MPESRYDHVRVLDRVAIYDRESDDGGAWIQSDTTAADLGVDHV